MAKGAETLIFKVPIRLSDTKVAYLAKMNPNGDQPVDESAAAVICKMAEELANGGMILTSSEIQRIIQATGLDPSCGEDLLPFLSAATGFEDGMHVVKCLIDPVWWPGIVQVAEYRGWSPEQVIHETLDWCLDNQHYEHLPEIPRHVLMSEKDVKELEEVLGGKFTSGCDLAAQIKKLVGGGGLFDEVPVEETKA